MCFQGEHLCRLFNGANSQGSWYHILFNDKLVVRRLAVVRGKFLAQKAEGQGCARPDSRLYCAAACPLNHWLRAQTGFEQ